MALLSTQIMILAIHFHLAVIRAYYSSKFNGIGIWMGKEKGISRLEKRINAYSVFFAVSFPTTLGILSVLGDVLFDMRSSKRNAFPLLRLFSSVMEPFFVSSDSLYSLTSVPFYNCDSMRVWFGCLLLEFGVLFLWWVHAEMREMWTPVVALRPKHKLITSGPFFYVRHPMYTSFIIFGMAWSLLSSNVAVLGSTITTAVILIMFRIEQEELLMKDEFGEQFEKFCQQTKYKLLPLIF